MKITRKELDSIIQEELAGVLEEQKWWETGPVLPAALQSAADAASKKVRGAVGAGQKAVRGAGEDLGAMVQSAPGKASEIWHGKKPAVPAMTKKEKAMATKEKETGPEWYPGEGGGEKVDYLTMGGLGRTMKDAALASPQEHADIFGHEVGETPTMLQRLNPMAFYRAGRHALQGAGDVIDYGAELASQSIATHKPAAERDYGEQEPGSIGAWNKWRRETHTEQGKKNIILSTKALAKIASGGMSPDVATIPGKVVGKGIIKPVGYEKKLSKVEAEPGLKGKLGTGAKYAGQEVVKNIPGVGGAYSMLNIAYDGLTGGSSVGSEHDVGTPQRTSYDIRNLSIKNRGPVDARTLGRSLTNELAQNPEVLHMAYVLGMLDTGAYEKVNERAEYNAYNEYRNSLPNNEERLAFYRSKRKGETVYDRIARHKASKEKGTQVAMKEEIDRVLNASVLKGNW